MGWKTQIWWHWREAWRDPTLPPPCCPTTTWVCHWHSHAPMLLRGRQRARGLCARRQAASLFLRGAGTAHTAAASLGSPVPLRSAVQTRRACRLETKAAGHLACAGNWLLAPGQQTGDDGAWEKHRAELAEDPCVCFPVTRVSGTNTCLCPVAWQQTAWQMRGKCCSGYKWLLDQRNMPGRLFGLSEGPWVSAGSGRAKPFPAAMKQGQFRGLNMGIVSSQCRSPCPGLAA